MFVAKLLAVITVLVAGFNGYATCVESIGYPTTLTLPSLEKWSSKTLSGGPEAECKRTNELVELFSLFPPTLRGTHSKGTCLAGEFKAELANSLSAEQKALLSSAGVFASDSVRRARFRFANGASKVDPDWKKDVRALSAKIDVEGEVQDFSFNNVPRFQIPALDSFVYVMELTKGIVSGEITVENGAPKLSSMVLYFTKRYGLGAPRVLWKLNTVRGLADEDTAWHTSYTTQNYWSTTAFAVGNSSANDIDRAVKFGAVPCSATDVEPKLNSEQDAKSYAESLVEKGEVVTANNFLSEKLTAQIALQPICYKLTVQFLSEEAGTASPEELVEDPSIVWNAPTHIVGEMKMTQPVDAATCESREYAMNTIKNQTGIIGVGQINRARNFVESASQARRGGK